MTGARIVGSGSTASATVYFSNGEVMTFESLRDVSNPRLLIVETAACAGAATCDEGTAGVPRDRAAANPRRHIESTSADGLATEWGLQYLQSAAAIEVSMDYQASRWAAFNELDMGGPDPMSMTVGPVLSDGGTRFVRADWFRRLVKRQEPSASAREISSRMLRVGWERRGAGGANQGDTARVRRHVAWGVPDRAEGLGGGR